MAPSETLIEDPPWQRRLRRLAPWLVLLAILVLFATPGWLYGLGDGQLMRRPMPILVIEDPRPDAGSDASLLAQPLAPR